MSEQPYQFPPSFEIKIDISREDYQKIIFVSKKRYITEKSLIERIVHDGIFTQYVQENKDA